MILQNLKNNNTLTSSEKAAADYILKNPDKVLKMTSRELAEQIYVSAPTIIRLCKKLGYESFTDFKMDLSKATTDEYQKTTEQPVSRILPLNINIAGLTLINKLIELEQDSYSFLTTLKFPPKGLYLEDVSILTYICIYRI